MVETVAEFTTNHMGNLHVLLRMVDAAAKAGADWIKMQKKDVATFYSPEKLHAPFASPYGHTYEEYRQTFEFDKEDWQRFDARCNERGIPWFCTIQDTPSLDFMLPFWLTRYKIASSNARNLTFLRWLSLVLPKHCEIVLSIAGSTLAEISEALDVLRDFRRVYVLHCVAEYPCRLDRVRLGNISVLRDRFEDDRVRIGYSGHEDGVLPTLAAVDLGAEMVERHFCLSRHSFVHHIGCSLEPRHFKGMVQMIRGSRKERKRLCQYLPNKAYTVQFGMTEEEEAFLSHQTYGDEHLGRQSHFGVRSREGA